MLYERAINTMNKTGNREMEADACKGLADVFQSVFEYYKARKYYERELSIKIEIGDKEGEARAYRSLGTVYESLAEYDTANESLEKALAITIEIGYRQGEAAVYISLGCVLIPLVNMTKPKNISRKHLRSQLKLDTDKEKQTRTET